MKKLLLNIKGDKVIWAVVILLSIFSVLAVYSSASTLAYSKRAGNTEYFLIKHFSVMVLGLVIMYLTHLVNYKYLSRISQLAFYISVPLLLFTLLFGQNINEASRWLLVPLIDLTFQPSDFAKLALIIYLSRLLAKKQDVISDFKKGVVPLIIPVFIIVGLVTLPNFSTGALIFIISIMMLFVGNVKFKHILTTCGIGLVGLLLVLTIKTVMPNKSSRHSTWETRIEAFMGKGDKNSRFQPMQAKTAIALGGITGKMPGNSTQKNFLPQAYSDYIYAIIIEEYGVIGGVVVLMLYMILFLRAIKIVSKSPRNFGAFLAFGLAFALIFQAMLNMLVVVDLMPVTGQPLPLLSMGGTSIWVTSISIGILLSISKENDIITNDSMNDSMKPTNIESNE